MNEPFKIGDCVMRRRVYKRDTTGQQVGTIVDCDVHHAYVQWDGMKKLRIQVKDLKTVTDAP